MKWISVEDRLPDYKDIVLAFIPDAPEYSLGESPRIAQAHFRKGYMLPLPWFCEWSGDFMRFYKLRGVTHWMPLPKSPGKNRGGMMIVKILGYEYKLYVTPTEGNAGEQCTFDQRLTVSGRQHPEQRESTLVHEIVEAVDKLLNLELAHHQITGMEVGIYSFIRDNNIEKLLDFVHDWKEE